MKIEKNQLYTTEEVAQILRVSVITVKRYIAENKITSIKFNGIRRIKGAEIIKVIEGNYGSPHKRKTQLEYGKN